jgi:flagellar biosynthetic protein FliP
VSAARAAVAARTPTAAQVDEKLPALAPQIDVRVGQGAGGLRLSGTVGVVVMMGLMTLLPTLLLMMTGFTRILVVLHFLRQALGTQSAPPGQLMAALALLLTGFVMAPTLAEVNETALQPWMNGTIEQAEMLSTGVRPFREFMFAQTRESDIRTFLEMSSRPRVASADEVPLVVLMTAFVTSELRTAFQIGFALFLPFIVIDVVVASVLMSMGMMMLPPAMIALPFKILLFVLVDGWALIAQGLVTSFR